MPTTDPITVPIKGKDELTPALKSAGGGVTGFVNGIKGMTAGLQDVTAGIGFLKVGLQAVGEAYTQTVGAAMSYGDTVRKLSRVTGESAEDTSRLIQLTDDLGVEMGDLEAAAATAARKGIAFTTESIAKLADEYVSLSDPVARNTLLIDNFGKSGLNMAGAMLQGGDAIRQMSKEVSANFILNEKQLQQQRELAIQQDNLNDTFEGTKITVGTQLVPYTLTYLTALNNLKDNQEALNQKLGTHFELLSPAVILYSIGAARLNQMNEATVALAKSTDTLTASAQRHTDAQRVAMQGNTSKTSGWNDPNWKPVQSFTQSQQTLTVKNDATLNVKVTAKGFDTIWNNEMQKFFIQSVRNMQAAGILPKATR